MEGFLIETEDLETTAHETAQNCDTGPAPNQAQPPANGDCVRTFEYVGEGGEKTALSARDKEIRDSLRKSVKKSTIRKCLAQIGRLSRRLLSTNFGTNGSLSVHSLGCFPVESATRKIILVL